MRLGARLFSSLAAIAALSLTAPSTTRSAEDAPPTDRAVSVAPPRPAPVAEPPAPVAEPPAATAFPVLGEHTTTFPTGGADAPRAANIRRAAALLNGAEIAPRTSFSFDDTVGPRTLARGFVRARVLVGGAYDEGVGGGICQLASTLFVAALRAGLPIERARPHSRLQRYAPPGLDVAISFRRSDLRFASDFDVPIRVETELAPGPDGTEAVTVRLRGDAHPREVEIAVHSERDLGVPDRVRIDRRVAPGERRVVAEGVRGAEVRRRRTIRYDDGRVVVERVDLRYPPVAREIRVHDASGL